MHNYYIQLFAVFCLGCLGGVANARLERKRTVNILRRRLTDSAHPAEKFALSRAIDEVKHG